MDGQEERDGQDGRAMTDEEYKDFLDAELLKAARAGCVACTESLIENGANVNQVDVTGQTALMKAARYHHVDCVKILITASADYTLADNVGRAALSYAVEERNEQPADGDDDDYNQVDIVWLLLNHLCYLRIIHSECETPLMSMV